MKSPTLVQFRPRQPILEFAMTVVELIKELKKMPYDAQVRHLWDGRDGTGIELVYLSKDGIVITSDFDQLCSVDHCRPVGAPNCEEDRFWSTPSER